ncbi:hypothetical protein TOK_2321 [Pseudonocardia sp. N23]|nr:hypothetical protein TOK_2321 [Pseudonocardia sp. N23]
MATPEVEVATSPTEVTVAVTGRAAPVGVTSAAWPAFSAATSVSSTEALTTNVPVEMTTTSAVVPVDELVPVPEPTVEPDPPDAEPPDPEDADPEPPAGTCWPTATSTAATVPAKGAVSVACERLRCATESWACAAVRAAESASRWAALAPESASRRACALATPASACATCCGRLAASTVARVSPAATCWPTVTGTAVTRPGTAKSRSARWAGAMVPVAPTVWRSVPVLARASTGVVVPDDVPARQTSTTATTTTTAAAPPIQRARRDHDRGENARCRGPWSGRDDAGPGSVSSCGPPRSAPSGTVVPTGVSATVVSHRSHASRRRCPAAGRADAIRVH